MGEDQRKQSLRAGNGGGDRDGRRSCHHVAFYAASRINFTVPLREKVLLTGYSHDCYAAGLLAIGQIDLLVETGVYAYDIAAQISVIEGAGGFVSDWSGNAPQLEHQGDFLAAATLELHAQALEMLGGVSDSRILTRSGN